jgi:hypothetical protein
LQSHSIRGGIRNVDDAKRDAASGLSKHITATSGDYCVCIHPEVARRGLYQNIATGRSDIATVGLIYILCCDHPNITGGAANQRRLSDIITRFQQDISIVRTDLSIDVSVLT